jgi:hypothetical protein
MRYNKPAPVTDSGVTCGVKLATIRSVAGSKSHTDGMIFPNVDPRGDEPPWFDSTAVVLTLKPGEYEFLLNDYFNMSHLEHNANYGAIGGESGPYNRFHLAGLTIIPLETTAQ